MSPPQLFFRSCKEALTEKNDMEKSIKIPQILEPYPTNLMKTGESCQKLKGLQVIERTSPTFLL